MPQLCEFSARHHVSWTPEVVVRAAGATDNGAPGPREYMPTYYAGYVYDAAGNNVECNHL